MTDHYLVIDTEGDLSLRCDAKPTLHKYPECWYFLAEDSDELDYSSEPSECNAIAWFGEDRWFTLSKKIVIPVEIEWNDDCLVIKESE